MQTERGRALLACLDPARRVRLRGVIEAAGYGPVVDAEGLPAILRALRDAPVELILADAILPGADGASLAARVTEAPLSVYPAVLVMCPKGLELPGANALADFGAAALEEPVTAEAMLSAIASLAARATRLPPEKSRRLDALFDRLGIPGHPGRAMLKNAAALAWRDRRRISNLRDRIYPDAARPIGRTAAQAERAIRHVIEAAWRNGEIDEQQKVFGDTIDARRGRPTCGEMIAQLADILRWEG